MQHSSDNLYHFPSRELSKEYAFRGLNSDEFSLADFRDSLDKDLFSKTGPCWEFIKDLTRKGFNTYRLPFTSACENRTSVIDRTTGTEKEIIMMGSCNYLGLATHPKVISAAKEALDRYGAGSEGAALLSGTFDVHRKLELKLAQMKGCEDAMLFPTGYAANQGIISALVKKDDITIIDRLAHASIIDGCLLSEGSFRTFRHSNIKNLKAVLERVNDKYNGKLIAVDGVYSMDGDIAPLPEIVHVAREYGAKVMIDEAHATGVVGKSGRGTASHFDMEGEVDIVMGTLSKTLGAVGGFVASTKEVVNYLRFYARSGFFSINLPPATAAAALAAVKVMENEPEIHANLLTNIRYMKENLRYLGFEIKNTNSAIIPIMIGEDMLLRKMDKRLHEYGLYVSGIPYPAVPKGASRFRLTVMATHTRDDMDKALEILEKVGIEFGVLSRGSDSYYIENRTGITAMI